MLKHHCSELSDPHPVTGEVRALYYGKRAVSDRERERDERFRQDFNRSIRPKLLDSGGSYSSRLIGSRLA